MCAKCEGWRRGGTWHRTAARSTHNGSSGTVQLAAPLQRMQPPRARHLSIGWKHALSFRWRTYQLHLVVHLVHVVQGDLDAGPAGRGAGCGSVRGGVGPDHRGGRLEEVEGCRGEGVVEPTVRSVCGAKGRSRRRKGTRWSEANEVDRNERSVCEAERGKWRWAKERKEEAWMRRVSKTKG